MKVIDFSARQSRKTIKETQRQNPELMPLFKKFYNLEHKKIPMFQTEYVKGDTNSENSSITNYLHQKMMFVANLKALTAITLMFVGYFAYYYEVDRTRSRDMAVFMYTFVTILSVFMLVLTIVEYYLYLARNREKKILQESILENNILFALKMIVYLIHPNMLFFRKQYMSELTFDGTYQVPSFKRDFNQYLYMFQFTFMYFVVLKKIVYNTMWANDSSDRITRMVGFRITPLYLVKCLMRDARKNVALGSMFTTFFYYMIILKIVEGPLFYDENMAVDYQQLAYPSITLWNAMITFFTIGYGDVNVVTYFGRIYVVFLAIISAIILSFITVAMTIDFDFGDTDKKAFDLINGVELKQEVDIAAARFLKATFQYRMALKGKSSVSPLLLKDKVDNYREAFIAKLNEYKNSKSSDDLVGIYKALCEFEDKIEEDEAKYDIVRKTNNL